MDEFFKACLIATIPPLLLEVYKANSSEVRKTLVKRIFKGLLSIIFGVLIAGFAAGMLEVFSSFEDITFNSPIGTVLTLLATTLMWLILSLFKVFE